MNTFSSSVTTHFFGSKGAPLLTIEIDGESRRVKLVMFRLIELHLLFRRSHLVAAYHSPMFEMGIVDAHLCSNGPKMVKSQILGVRKNE